MTEHLARAFVLDRRPHREQDLRVTLLTEHGARVDAVALGGQRSKQRFMGALGLRTMVRGHERVTEGFRKVYDDSDAMLLSVFSAGGKTNDDLPPTSNYREVTPMALTIRHRNGVSEVAPFVIDYARYNDPRVNQFFQGRIAD